MKTYHVELEGWAYNQTKNCASYEEAERLWRHATEAGNNARAYYIEDGKAYDLFTDEEV